MAANLWLQLPVECPLRRILEQEMEKKRGGKARGAQLEDSNIGEGHQSDTR